MKLHLATFNSRRLKQCYTALIGIEVLILACKNQAVIFNKII